jgi:hypothetical protein
MVRRRVSSIRGWLELDKALDRVEAIKGSRERAEQELCEHLNAGLPVKVWCQGGGRGRWDRVSLHWTPEILRALQSADGVFQDGKWNWYYVKLSRFEELYPAARKLSDTPSTPKQAGQRATPRRVGNKGGNPPEHDWEGAGKYVDDQVATRGGPFPSQGAVVRLLVKWFPRPPNGPTPRTIQQWLQKKKKSKGWWVSE